MTAKEALHERIDELSDDEPAEMLAQLEWESTEEEELTPGEAGLLAQAGAEFERGDVVDGDQFLKSLGL